MRKVMLSDNKEVNVRPMNRKEIQDGEQFGLGIMAYTPTRESLNAGAKYILDTQFSDLDEDTSNQDQTKLVSAILKETYGNKDEEKNLLKSGPGAQTQPGSNGAKNAANGNP